MSAMKIYKSDTTAALYIRHVLFAKLFVPAVGLEG